MSSSAKHLGVVLVGILLVALSACGSGSSDDSTASKRPSGPVTISHQYGETTFDSVPKTVVTLSMQWSDTLATLDIPIAAEFVASTFGTDPAPWTPAHESTVIARESDTEVPLEEIASYKPDVILAGYIDEKNYDALSDIAPTIPVMDTEAQQDSWEDVLAATGKIFDREDAAAKAQASADETFAQFKADHPEAQGQTFVFSQYSGDKLAVVAAESDPASRFMAALGFTLDPAVLDVAKGNARVFISFEQIDVLSSDLLLMWSIPGKDALADLTGFDSLPAVKSGQVVYLDNLIAAGLSSPSVASVTYAVTDLIEPVMAQA